MYVVQKIMKEIIKLYEGIVCANVLTALMYYRCLQEVICRQLVGIPEFY